MYFRVKRTGTYAYLQIVESFREANQVRQRVLATVGRLDALQASGQLEALLRSGLRFCEKLAVIDAHAAGQTQGVPSVDVRRVEEPGNSAKSARRAALPEDGQAGGGCQDQPVSAEASAWV